MWKFVCGCVAVLACGAARADEAEDRAARWAESVEGRLTRDDKTTGNPVVGVMFGPLNKKVTDDGLKNLAGLKNLKTLTIFFCEQITDAGMKHVKGLTTLEALALDNTGVGDAGLEDLKDLKNLKVLRLVGCVRLTDKCADTINGFADLEELSLPFHITEKGVKNLVGMKKLRSFYLGGGDPTDAAVASIAGNMPNLESLELGTFNRGTSITDASVPQFAKLKKLKTLGIAGSKVSGGGLKELQKALPDCKIKTR